MKTVYTIKYLSGAKKNLCGKCSNRHRESTDPSLGYHINWDHSVKCESGKHK